jgi:hypothetical protein
VGDHVTYPVLIAVSSFIGVLSLLSKLLQFPHQRECNPANQVCLYAARNRNAERRVDLEASLVCRKKAVAHLTSLQGLTDKARYVHPCDVFRQIDSSMS